VIAQRHLGQPVPSDAKLANAENNNKLSKDNLYIKTIYANEGRTLKRWRPRAYGRAAMIRKRLTHVTVVLDEKVPTKQPTQIEAKKDDKKKKADAQSDAIVAKDLKEVKQLKKKISGSDDQASTGGGKEQKARGKGGKRGFSQKIFNRKAG